jgi:uncharacterized RDD family membrane protein YckC
MNAIVPSLSIRTPEGVTFNLLLAGIVPRFLAWLLDALAVLATLLALSMLAQAVGFLSQSAQRAALVICNFLVPIGYGIFFEWVWRGQTPGKKLFRLRVLDVQGLRLQLSQIVVRNALRAVDSLPLFYLAGGVACFLSRRSQRLGDLAANTIVVRYPRILPPNIDELSGGKFNSLREYPHLEARLRQTVTPEEAALALEALRRARLLAPQERLDLFDQLAGYFGRLVEFPPEVTDLLSSEQYVRNVVEVIYRGPIKAR